MSKKKEIYPNSTDDMIEAVKTSKQFLYNDNDFVIAVKGDKKSRFDIVLEHFWNIKMKANLFKFDYRWLEYKTLPGKFGFVAQMSTLRSLLKRQSHFISSVIQLYNPDEFNFNQVPSNEKLFHLSPQHWIKDELGDIDIDIHKTLLLINTSPVSYLSCLLIPGITKGFPQIINFDALRFAIETILLSSDPFLRVGFNSAGAFASINHMHFHVFHLKENLYLQSAPVRKVFKECYKLTDYPAEGFCFEILDIEQFPIVLKSAMKLILWLQLKSIAHNLFITRAVPFNNSAAEIGNYKAIRIYIWARKSFFGMKCNSSFNPAVCELAGLLMIKDSETYQNITEDEAASILHNMCHEQFVRVEDNILKVYSRR